MTTDIKGLPEGYKPGLEGIVAGTSTISEVNPEKDALIYRGFPAHELAEKATFSEVAYLFLYGSLPNKKQLEDFRQDLIKERDLDPAVLNVLKNLPKTANPMVAMRVGISACHMLDPQGEENTPEANLSKAIRLIAKAPTIVSTIYRIQKGLDLIPSDPNLKHGANFVNMMFGKVLDNDMAKAFDSTMILYVEHGYNASTFSGLVTASTLSDMHSAVASAIGTLKGPLHGGANEKAIDMLLKIGDASKGESWVKDALARKEKIMGFGHRVYKKQDSRAPYMKKLAALASEKYGDKNLFPLSINVEETLMREKKLFPNVDYHCAVFYYLIGLPPEVYTPIFAMSRMVGWTSHIIEQHANNRLIRPKCVYTGDRDVTFKPIEKR